MPCKRQRSAETMFRSEAIPVTGVPLHGNTRDRAREKLFLPALSRAKFDPRSLAISGERRGQRTCPRVSPGVLLGLARDFSREMASPGSLPGGSPGFSPGIGLSGPLLCRVCPRTSPRERRVCPRTSPRPRDTDLSPGSSGPPGSLSVVCCILLLLIRIQYRQCQWQFSRLFSQQGEAVAALLLGLGVVDFPPAADDRDLALCPPPIVATPSAWQVVLHGGRWFWSFQQLQHRDGHKQGLNLKPSSPPTQIRGTQMVFERHFFESSASVQI